MLAQLRAGITVAAEPQFYVLEALHCRARVAVESTGRCLAFAIL